MRVPLWLKIAWTIWVVIWAPMYWKQYGTQNFLYFCDLGNFLIAIGLWMESALIFSWQACGLLLFQTIYLVDVTGRCLSGRHWIGGTEFMFNANLPLVTRLLSLFHVIVPLLLLWAIWRLGYDARGWKLQTLTAWIVVPINYLWRPECDVNFARGPFYHEQQWVSGPVYLLAYLVLVPLLVYFPTHIVLQYWSRRIHASETQAGTLLASK